jgi:hypothetical protein
MSNLILKICDPDGSVLFAGLVEPDDIEIRRPPNAPASCIVKIPVVYDTLAALGFTDPHAQSTRHDRAC